MCQQHQQTAAAYSANINNQMQQSTKLKPSYSIKRVLQTLFRNKQQQHQQQQKQKQQRRQHERRLQHQRLCNSLESLESLENLRNAQMEEQHFYEEIEDNSANEKLVELVQEADDEHDVYVPVRFARTEAGTFFWTTNLQPVLSSFAPVAADEDLLQPSYCYSNTQYPHMQYPCQQDRWGQA